MDPSPTPLESTASRWLLYGAREFDGLATRVGEIETLVREAREAKSRAYAPYSKFRVGAAVRMDGIERVGTNVENASYGGTLCAERTAIAAAVAAGGRRLDLVAVSTDSRPGSLPERRSPCGLCRQFMSEFADVATLVVLDAGDDEAGRLSGEIVAFDLLLPWRFRLD